MPSRRQLEYVADVISKKQGRARLLNLCGSRVDWNPKLIYTTEKLLKLGFLNDDNIQNIGINRKKTWDVWI